MNAWRHRLQVFIGLWVFIGLVVAGINGYALLPLLDEPLAGYSSGALQASRAFQQYRRLMGAETDKISSVMKILAQRFAISEPKINPAARLEKEKRPATVEKKVKRPLVRLPVLAGIVNSRSAAGQVYRMALLDNGVFSEGEMLRDFTIRKISADGVLLTKGKKTWLLKRPEIDYSIVKQ
jgi:hypothetical protein